MNSFFKKQPEHPTECLSVVTTDGPAPEGYELATAETLAAAYDWAKEQKESGAWVPVPPPEPTPSVEQIWADKLAGFLTVNGLDLKANRSAKNDFTGMFTLISGGIAAGAITAATPIDIWDAHNAKHTLPASEILALLLGYGFAWQAMFNEFAP